LQAFITNDVIAKAVDYAIATTAGAAHAKTASIPVANELIACPTLLSNDDLARC
jgi:hypothetical protein